MTRRVTVRGVIVHEGKLLCVRLKPYRIRTTKDFWCTPGGGIDEGENLLDALSREMVEETGIKPVIGNLLYVQQFADEHEEQMEFFFHITNSVDYLEIDLSKASHGEEEIADIAFVDPKTTHILPEFLTQESYEDLGSQATKIFSYL